MVKFDARRIYDLRAGIAGHGMHDFILDEIELGPRAALAIDDPDQVWWVLWQAENPPREEEMSHCFGSICETHGWVIQNDRFCPERDCPGGHGYTLVECSERCFMHPDWDGEQMPPPESSGWTDNGDGTESMPLSDWVFRNWRVTDE